jgi:hypothetical protein
VWCKPGFFLRPRGRGSSLPTHPDFLGPPPRVPPGPHPKSISQPFPLLSPKNFPAVPGRWGVLQTPPPGVPKLNSSLVQTGDVPWTKGSLDKGVTSPSQISTIAHHSPQGRDEVRHACLCWAMESIMHCYGDTDLPEGRRQPPASQRPA